jgi:hypothetical protein
MNRQFRLAAAIATLATLAMPGFAETPKDPKSPVPGHVDGRGPTGPVEVKIVSPKPDEVIPIPEAAVGQPPAKGAPVTVKFEVKNFDIFTDEKTKDGQHINFILDQGLSFTHTDARKGWVFKSIPKGTHTIRAFVQRPWHETIKEPAAFAMVTFHVGEKDGKNTPEPGTPVLSVTSPHGKYKKSEAEKLLFDFWVAGCRVSEEAAPDTCRVRYKLDDKPEVKLTKWEPHWWEGLTVGKHAYVAGLTRDDKLIPGNFALASGTFEIVDETAAPADPGAPSTASAAPKS